MPVFGLELQMNCSTRPALHASIPFQFKSDCSNSTLFLQSGVLCKLVDWIIKFAIYCDFVQEHLAPAGYVKIPNDIDDYKSGCTFLPKLNNEVFINSTYKERFSSLKNLVLIMFDGDTILVPKETSWFGYYPEGSWSPILSAQETTLYKEDWIGLKTLDEAGKVKFLKVPGTHLEISLKEMESYILPYLVEENTTQLTSTLSQPSNHQKYIDRTINFKIRLHNDPESTAMKLHAIWSAKNQEDRY
ncbi:hypothetical protein Leryth_024489 [Lithospermum erythrorhizon]|nr:hypothetical protein Leryth_024489 [Lithospermum erythrorhizon]